MISTVLGLVLAYAICFAHSSTADASESDYFAPYLKGSYQHSLLLQVAVEVEAIRKAQKNNVTQTGAAPYRQAVRKFALLNGSDDSFVERAKDASSPLSEMTEKLLAAATRNANLAPESDRASMPPRCEESKLVKEIADAMASSIAKSHIEEEAERLPNIDQFHFLRETSIYQDFDETDGTILKDHRKSTCCATIFKIGDTLVSGDKLDHFFEFGRFYYGIAARNEDLEKPMKFEWKPIVLESTTFPAAILPALEIYYSRSRRGGELRDALEFGLSAERGSYGLTSNGVLSYADLAANYQGLQFYREVVNGPNPYFKCKSGLWTRTKRKFNWNDYVDDAWDESVNCNAYRSAATNSKVAAVLERHKSRSCPISPDRCKKIGQKHRQVGQYILNPMCRETTDETTDETTEAQIQHNALKPQTETTAK